MTKDEMRAEFEAIVRDMPFDHYEIVDDGVTLCAVAWADGRNFLDIVMLHLILSTSMTTRSLEACDIRPAVKWFSLSPKQMEALLPHFMKRIPPLQALAIGADEVE